MIHNVYAVFDTAVKAFLPPFCLRNDAQAIRTFTDCINSPNHQFNEHPEDYALYLMGNFDDSLGSFVNLEPGPKNLGIGLAFKRMPNVTPSADTPPSAGLDTRAANERPAHLSGNAAGQVPARR